MASYGAAGGVGGGVWGESGGVMEGESCSNCRFWMVFDEDELDMGGECRRYPPLPANTQDQQDEVYSLQSPDEADDPWESRHPVTGPNEWCGEWKEKPKTSSS